MTEAEALEKSTKWVNGTDGLYGYLPLAEANFLVGTGRYIFHQVTMWGYVVQSLDNLNTS